MTSINSNICDSTSNYSVSTLYDTEGEIDPVPVHVILTPSDGIPGQHTPALDVDTTDKVDIPTSLPLCMCANARSVYNKVDSLRNILNTIGPDITIISETWERKNCSLEQLLCSSQLKCVSYCRSRDFPSGTQTGGGCAIIYNQSRFHTTQPSIGIPEGVEATWAVFTPKKLDSHLQKVKNICVGAIYISPKSKYKQITIEHIIHTIHRMRAEYNNEINFYIGGDFNRVCVKEIVQSYGALQQVCSVPTRKGATLELILTDLHTYYHPPTVLSPLTVDSDKKGKDSDHGVLIFAPKASDKFKVKREKKKIETRPLPESQIYNFCSELTQFQWKALLETPDVNTKVQLFHTYIRYLLDKYFPLKYVTVSNLDKEWMNPELKSLLRKVQREFFKHGKSERYKHLKNKFRRQKRRSIKTFYSKFVNELKSAQPGKWFQMAKRLGGGDQLNMGRLEIKCLEGKSDRDCAQAVAQSFAAVSQEYEPVDRMKLPAFLPAEEPMQVDIIEVIKRIQSVKKTRSTLPIDIPDKLRLECAVDLAEPLTDIFNSCLREGKFPVVWRREWVTPVPKTQDELKTLKDVRKISSTSDYSKLFESFLKDWIMEDIGDRLNINQFAGRKGMGTEHMIVCMIDGIKQLLDGTEKSAVIAFGADWISAFDCQDPTIAVSKMVAIGIRSSLIPILIEFLTDRKMSVKFNGVESDVFSLVGGGPQGSFSGMISYIIASNDNADHVPADDQYKYCDDLRILELVMIGGLLVEYDFTQHVASDIGIDQLFLPPTNCSTQQNIDRISLWTSQNLAKLNPEKSDYMIFTRAREQFSTRFQLEGKVLDRKYFIKLVGVWH